MPTYFALASCAFIVQPPQKNVGLEEFMDRINYYDISKHYRDKNSGTFLGLPLLAHSQLSAPQSVRQIDKGPFKNMKGLNKTTY
jgi:hypothetical protein